jgi:hypothetical protein
MQYSQKLCACSNISRPSSGLLCGHTQPCAKPWLLLVTAHNTTQHNTTQHMMAQAQLPTSCDTHSMLPFFYHLSFLVTIISCKLWLINLVVCKIGLQPVLEHSLVLLVANTWESKTALSLVECLEARPQQCTAQAFFLMTTNQKIFLVSCLLWTWS